MTATKAIAGGIAANVVTVILWAISIVPGWTAVPDQPKAAIIALVSAAVGAAIVYFAPPNQETVPEPASAGGGELKASFGSGRVLGSSGLRAEG
jgi:hypothetical protein